MNDAIVYMDIIYFMCVPVCAVSTRYVGRAIDSTRTIRRTDHRYTSQGQDSYYNEVRVDHQIHQAISLYGVPLFILLIDKPFIIDCYI